MNDTNLRIYDQLHVEIHPTNQAMGEAAALYLVETIQALHQHRETANLIFATGNSMLHFYAGICRHHPKVDWQRVRIFHMDEYVGMRADHPASFRRYLHEKVIDRLHPQAFFEVRGDTPDAVEECKRYADLLARYPADVCCLGIGENGHLAFNDPPYADFDDPQTVKIVRLAEKSRRQQVGEGHFASLAEVPVEAITLTIPALLAPPCVIGIVPEARKAEAVKAALLGPITEDCPASILRQTSQARLFLDEESASFL
jgi:glucosamine-6-phosphate deaminase